MSESDSTPATAAPLGGSAVPERFRSTSAPSFAGWPYDQQPRTPGTGADPRFSTLPTDTLRRILWAAKGAPCTCIQSAGMSVGNNGETAAWVGPKWDCPRCTAIRDVCEAVPDVL